MDNGASKGRPGIGLTSINRALIREDLLRVHTEDAAMLLELRRLAVEAPNYRMVDIYDLDQRIAGHLDYLRLAGPQAKIVAAENFAENPGRSEATVS
jgi:hypothetical protein